MALVFTPTANPAFGGSEGSYVGSLTFSSVAIGTASADRIVVVAVLNIVDRTGSVTVGGENATQVVEDDPVGDSYHCSIWQCALATGTTADIVVYPEIDTENVVGILVGTLNGATAAATDTAANAYDFHPDPHEVTCTVPSGGVMLVAGFSKTINASCSFSQGTKDYTITLDGATYDATLCFGHLDGVTGDQTVGVTIADYSGAGAVAATWEPAAAGGASPGSIVPTITL